MTAGELKLARGFALPLDMVTEATAIVATRGAGKSSTGAVFVEEAFAAHVPVVVIDWTGVFWGLRSNAAGDGAGLAVYVFGGPHGDLPLEPTAGAFMADLVVDFGHSFVFDLSDFTKSHARQFAADFLSRLYDRKARARTSMLLVIDEAHELAPQSPRGGFKGMLAVLMGAMEQVVGLGRSRGIGVVLITTRTQSLNKAVLDLIETLLVMRMLSPRSINAVRDWILEKEAEDEQGVLPSLKSLPTGTAWVWSPLRGVLEKVAIRRIKTFDSYVTPKPGETRVEPKARKELDLDALGERMRATVERAKENDPAELRKRVRELERRLAAGASDNGRIGELERYAADIEARLEQAEAREPERVEIPVVTDAQIERLANAARELRDVAASVGEFGDAITRELATLTSKEASRGRTEPRRAAPAAARATRDRPPPRPSRPQPRPAAAPDDAPAALAEGEVTRPQQKLLDGLAWWEAVGVDAPTRGQLAFVAGYSHAQSRGFRDPLYGLNAGDLVAYPEGGRVRLTPAGADLAQPPPHTPSEAELQRMILDLVGKNRARMLEELLRRYPNEASRDDLAAALGYSHAQSRGFRDPLYRLHALELVEYPSPGYVRASELNFLS